MLSRSVGPRAGGPLTFGCRPGQASGGLGIISGVVRSLAWAVCSSRGAGVEADEELAQVDAFLWGERCQEPALLLVEDGDGGFLGGPAGIGWADEKSPAVPGMPLADDQSPLFQVVDEGDHGCPVDPQLSLIHI